MDTEVLTLPSGATATVRTDVDYGATMDLEEIGARLAAKLQIQQGPQRFTLVNGDGTAPQPGSDPGGLKAVPQSMDMAVNVDAESVVGQAVAQRYFALTYMLTGWSLPLPLPTLDNLTPLRQLSLRDGKWLTAECQRRFDEATTLDDGPNPDSESPGQSSSASAPTPEETTPEGASPAVISATASSA